MVKAGHLIVVRRNVTVVDAFRPQLLDKISYRNCRVIDDENWRSAVQAPSLLVVDAAAVIQFRDYPLVERFALTSASAMFMVALSRALVSDAP